MKKKIICLIVSMFAITAKASTNNEVCSIKSFDAGLYGETRGDARLLSERLKNLKIPMHFKEVTLTLLDPKVMPAPNDGDKSIGLLELKKNQSKIELKAILIDKKNMDKSVQGLLLARFSSDAFMRDMEQQIKNKKVYFKISGQYGQSVMYTEFYFSVPSKQIISDFGLEKQSEISEKKRAVELFVGKIYCSLFVIRDFKCMVF